MGWGCVSCCVGVGVLGGACVSVCVSVCVLGCACVSLLVACAGAVLQGGPQAIVTVMELPVSCPAHTYTHTHTEHAHTHTHTHGTRTHGTRTHRERREEAQVHSTITASACHLTSDWSAGLTAGFRSVSPDCPSPPRTLSSAPRPCRHNTLMSCHNTH